MTSFVHPAENRITPGPERSPKRRYETRTRIEETD